MCTWRALLTGFCACILACHDLRCNRVNNKQTFSSHDLIGPTSRPFRSVHRYYKSSHSRHNIVQTFHPEQIIQLTSNMLVSRHDLIQALETSHNFLCLRHHLSANKNIILSDYLPNASEGKGKQHSAHIHAQRMHNPHAHLLRKVCVGQQSVSLYTLLVRNRSGCSCISVTAMPSTR